MRGGLTKPDRESCEHCQLTSAVGPMLVCEENLSSIQIVAFFCFKVRRQPERMDRGTGGGAQFSRGIHALRRPRTYRWATLSKDPALY